MPVVSRKSLQSHLPTHCVRMKSSTKRSTLQSSCEVLPDGEVVPAGHGEQSSLRAPSSALYVPIAHALHASPPTESLNVPTGHGSQLGPVNQALHAKRQEGLSLSIWVALGGRTPWQSSHAALPTPDLYFPVAH
eukprot:2006023-Rhodomonas_salina.1